MKVTLKTLSDNATDGPEPRVLSSGPSLMGQAANCTIKLSCPSVSRWHCLVDVVPNAVYVTDLRSRNGTYVNDHRAIRQALRDGDRLKLGDLLFKVSIGHGEEVPTASDADAVGLPALEARTPEVVGSGPQSVAELNLPQRIPPTTAGQESQSTEIVPAEFTKRFTRYEKALENCSDQLGRLLEKVSALEAKLDTVVSVEQADHSPSKAFEGHDAMMYIARAAVSDKVRQQQSSERRLQLPLSSRSGTGVDIQA